MRVLVTGAQGFIGKNLTAHLNEQEQFSVLVFARENTLDELQGFVEQADAVVHLAGENRPKDVSAFKVVNTGLTQSLCDAIRTTGRKIPLVLASSIQIEQDNPYGKSKLAAERAVRSLANETGNPVYIYRLPGVFGKWCKPNYNSVVATFCYNISRNIPIQINDESVSLRLVYVDDVVLDFIRVIQQDIVGVLMPEVKPEYSITLGELSEQISAFQNCRTNLITERVGTGLVRALYSTYMSYLSPEEFAYDLPKYSDERGSFIEMLKTRDSGQFSFFTAHSEVTRGGHYHHSKTEKFLVIKGLARFRFRHVDTDEVFEIFTSGDEPQVVDTIPGWAHEITNVGEEEMIVILWANEIFNQDHPDTLVAKV
jgi:UDP-2-acetamido-2,6-beta-L-arabino-hexul-4-ose reductase